MKRRMHATVTLEYWVDLDIDDEEQVCADHDVRVMRAKEFSAARKAVEEML